MQMKYGRKTLEAAKDVYAHPCKSGTTAVVGVGVGVSDDCQTVVTIDPTSGFVCRHSA